MGITYNFLRKEKQMMTKFFFAGLLSAASSSVAGGMAFVYTAQGDAVQAGVLGGLAIFNGIDAIVHLLNYAAVSSEKGDSF